jgi:hypothetical protein
MNLPAIIEIAERNVNKGEMRTSAASCLADAKRFANRCEVTAARRALRSIAYSVGILHADYAEAFKLSGFPGKIRLF